MMELVSTFCHFKIKPFFMSISVASIGEIEDCYHV